MGYQSREVAVDVSDELIVMRLRVSVRPDTRLSGCFWNGEVIEGRYLYSVPYCKVGHARGFATLHVPLKYLPLCPSSQRIKLWMSITPYLLRIVQITLL